MTVWTFKSCASSVNSYGALVLFHQFLQLAIAALARLGDLHLFVLRQIALERRESGSSR